MTTAQENRLAELTAKIRGGEGLTMAERLERQGIIFGHCGRQQPGNTINLLMVRGRRKPFSVLPPAPRSPITDHCPLITSPLSGSAG